MTTITIAQMNTAIETTLATATGLAYSQNYNELTEGMQDTPTLQVYWYETETDVTGGAAQRSFGGKVREKRFTFRADLFARQRSHLGEDMAALLPLVEAIHTVLEAQQAKPYFGLEGIAAIERWSAQQIIFELAGYTYLGARFTIPVRVH